MKEIWTTHTPDNRVTVSLKESLETRPSRVHVSQTDFEKRGFRTTVIDLTKDDFFQLLEVLRGKYL